MKKFLTHQVNEDENRKINFVNFIDEGCLVLRNLYKIMNNRVVNIPKYILVWVDLSILVWTATKHNVNIM